MTQKIKPNIWKFSFKKFGSYVYLIKLNEKNILIDTSSSANKNELIKKLGELNTSTSDINIIILTHHHFDHIENSNLFQNAKVYGGKKDFPEKKVLNIDKLKIPEFKIIKTPGHSKGGICILYKNILFSGDTLFHRKLIGRTDLPGSSKKEMKNSLKKLSKLKYKILCPGHGSEKKP